MNNQIGTLIRCADISEARLAFYKQIGLDSLQLAGVYEEYLAPTVEAQRKSDALFALFEKYSLSVPSMFLSFTGQSWQDISGTIGITPVKLRSQRLLACCRQMLWAKRYNIKYISCHIGELPPEDTQDYADIAADLKELVKFCASLDEEFLLETGMENADGLEKLFKAVGEKNLGINFDPANLVYYNCDRPENVLERHFEAVKVVHCKDAVPGEPFGKETVLGEGATNFVELLTDILQRGFAGPLIIERELPMGPEQENDVKNAVALIKNIIKGVEK